MKNLLIYSVIILLCSIGQAFPQSKWELQNPWPTSADLADIYAINDNKLVACGLTGTLLVSEDGGLSWNKKAIPLEDGILRIHFIDSAAGFILTSEKIFKTEDGGNNWFEFNTGINLTNLEYWDLKFTDRSNGWLLLSSGSLSNSDINANPGKVYKTSDGGKSWSEVNFDFKGRLLELSIPSKGNIFIVSNEPLSLYDGKSFLYKSSDNGLRWSKLESPFLAYTRNQMFFINENVGWVGNFKTTNGCESWASKLDTLSEVILVKFNDPDHGWISDRTTVLRTIDGGENWEITKDTFETTIMSLNFLNNMVGFTSGYGGSIYKTVNGGENWKKISRGNLNYLSDLDLQDDKNCWVVGDHGTILHTEDGGSNWIQQQSGTEGSLESVDFIDDQHGWAVGQDFILHTDNRGVQWVKQGYFLNSWFRSVKFIDAQNGWVVGDRGIVLHTNDGGKLWKTVGTGFRSNFYDVEFNDSLNGWICGDGILLSTADGGLKWRVVLIMNSSFRNVQFVDSQNGFLFDYARSALLKTEDGGINWTVKLFSDFGFFTINSVYFSDRYNGWACRLGEILKSNDGGLTWKREVKLPVFNISSLKTASNGSGWAVGSDGAIYKYSPSEVIDGKQMFQASVGNYPNPFNSSTNIYFKLAGNEHVTVSIYDCIGNRVEVIYDRQASAGINFTTWNASNYTSGIYFAVIQCNEYNKVVKTLLIK